MFVIKMRIRIYTSSTSFILTHLIWITDEFQWRIQVFPDLGANIKGGGANLCFGKTFAETK